MLILSRKKDEQIVIGDDITVTVVEIRGNKVRLGITAPEEVRVDRMEIHELRKAGVSPNPDPREA